MKQGAGTMREGGMKQGAGAMREDQSETAQGARFRRFQEVHYQRGYRLEQMKKLLEKAGLLFVEARDVDTHGEVRPESERIYVVARKGWEITANQNV